MSFESIQFALCAITNRINKANPLSFSFSLCFACFFSPLYSSLWLTLRNRPEDSNGVGVCNGPMFFWQANVAKLSEKKKTHKTRKTRLPSAKLGPFSLFAKRLFVFCLLLLLSLFFLSFLFFFFLALAALAQLESVGFNSNSFCSLLAWFACYNKQTLT